MAYPIKICAICSAEFELKPDKPGFANRCPDCSTSETKDQATKGRMDSDERRADREVNDSRKQAIRDLLYRKDS
jgi:hypothetical protein